MFNDIHDAAFTTCLKDANNIFDRSVHLRLALKQLYRIPGWIYRPKDLDMFVRFLQYENILFSDLLLTIRLLSMDDFWHSLNPW